MTINEIKKSVLEILDKIESNNGSIDDNNKRLVKYDFRVSLFVSALNSYRCDSILKPFPNQYINDDNEKQFDTVKSLIDEIPVLSQLNDSSDMTDECWKLLHWIITTGTIDLKLKSINCLEFQQLLAANHLSLKNFSPNLIFEVVSQPKKSFLSAKQQFGTFYAFHGSKAENVHSILHNGLVNCLNKRMLYGSGTYLSSQISVAIEFSPFGTCWSKSMLGRELSCVALCQVVKHPDIIKRNLTKEVPNAYYVVQNDDMVYVSHILVYYKNRRYNNVQNNGIKSAIYNNRSSLLFISLIVILICIGMKYS